MQSKQTQSTPNQHIRDQIDDGDELIDFSPSKAAKLVEHSSPSSLLNSLSLTNPFGISRAQKKLDLGLDSAGSVQ